MLDDPNFSDEPNYARRRTFHEFNSLSLVRRAKSSTFGLGVRLYTIIKKRSACTDWLGGVTRLSIQSLILISSRLHNGWGDPPHVTSPACKQALSSYK